MKKVFLLITAMLLAGMVFADGDKTLTKQSLKYSPDPSSGNVTPALNIFLGPGSVNGLGFSLGGDFEIPMFVDNLTIGPGVGLGVGRRSYWFGHTNTFDLKLNAVAYYYFDWLIPNMPDKFDVFANLNTGVRFRSYTDYYDSYYTAYYSKSSETYTNFGFNIETYVGGRYNFSENMSLYAKVGYGSYYGAFGISFKF